ncbi:MAG: phosphoribosylglycinamide formyltransferase [Bacteroidales bacterium]|nr:phosphoribosylglycinamide formyltransferase [Bacteroidales bacterium]
MDFLPRIAIFASGSGSNAQRIIEYFSEKNILEIAGIYCNNPSAYVLERAKNLNVPARLFNKEQFYHSSDILEDLRSKKVDWVVLAGFLWLIPSNILQAYPDHIINLHPALLPKFGGKGMFGSKVHESVIRAGEPESGITIHYVNEKYDEGKVIFQARCPITESDTSETLASKIHALEYEYLPKTIEKLVSGVREK